MILDTGEELLAAAIGPDNALTSAAQSLEPFIVPYDQLARLDGWIVWVGHPPVPDGLSLLPAPGHLLWGDPVTALAATAAVAADYAARRGARNPDDLQTTLARESPIAMVVPGEIAGTIRTMVNQIASIGVPLLIGGDDLHTRLQAISPFAMRRSTHRQIGSRAHDPALSFQTFITVGQIGGNALSSYVLHDEGECDEVSVTGDVSDRIAIEIGIRGPGHSLASTAPLEERAAVIPAFLTGVSSRSTGGSLEIGWRPDAKPTGQEIGEAFHVWLKALYNLELVDVRIAFAPEGGRSAVLARMRERARQIKVIRSATIAGDPNPRALLDDEEPT